MDALPPELKFEVLCALPDIPTLCCLIHASSEMYRTFANAQSLVLRHILQKEIPLNVRPEAEAVYISSTSPRDLSCFFRFVGSYPKILRFEQSESPITLFTAIHLSKMHDCVTSLTTHFCTSILSRNPVSGLPDNDYHPPSENEIHRIQRTFYRLELYCNIARREKDMDNYELEVDSPSGHLTQFLLSMPPWELEHLACVRDYCYRQISSPLNQVVLHDVMYGVNMVQVCWDPSFPNFRKIGILSSGLGMVHKLLTSKTYKKSKKLIDHSAAFKYHILHETVLADAYTYDAGLSIDDVYDETVTRYKETFVKGWRENDKGPIAAWRWAFASPRPRHQLIALLSFHPSKADLRDWAYCIWDHSRLRAWDLFAKPWNNKRARLRQERLHQIEKRNGEGLEWTWAQRAYVFQRGGKHRFL